MISVGISLIRIHSPLPLQPEINLERRFVMKTTIILFAVLCMPALAFSATIYVPDDYPTIQGAIDASVNGDTIIVRPGTYVENIDFLGKAVTLQSDAGPEVTVIDGGDPGPTHIRSVVIFYNKEGPDSVLDGFTITNGYGGVVPAYAGGGICCISASPTIKNNIITGNTALYGGGVCCAMDSTTITNNLITDNHAPTGYGGGIYCYTESNTMISDNILSGNSAKVGGAVSTSVWGDVEILNNMITGNEADHGGGVCCSDFPDTDSLVMGNIIVGNSATINGGGICGGESIYNNIISGNTAGESGGGIYHGYFGGSICNNTLSGNSAGQFGGGFFKSNFRSNTNVTNTILWNNEAPAGPEIHGTKLYVEHCDVKGGWPGTNNIDSDPLFVDPDNGDFHIRYTSPCRDVGAYTHLQVDFDGDPRAAYGTADIGADEFYTHLYCTGDFTPSGSIEGKFVGLPGTSPVGLFLGSGVLDPPLPTIWGSFHLQVPWLMLPLVPIPGDGVLVLPATIPATPPAPYDLPMQALIGLQPDSLTNLYVLEVR
jgi:hypothetical protein